MLLDYQLVTELNSPAGSRRSPNEGGKLLDPGFGSAILNVGELCSGSAPHREDLPGKTMMLKRPAAKFDSADLVV